MKRPPEPTLLVTISEAARLLNLSRPTVRKLLGQPGGLRERRVGRRRLIPRASLEAFADGRSDA